MKLIEWRIVVSDSPALDVTDDLVEDVAGQVELGALAVKARIEEQFPGLVVEVVER